MADSHHRRAIAYIAGRLVTGRTSVAVYDYSEAQHFNFSGNVTSQHVNVYDFGECCHVGGNPRSLYHFGDGEHIQLNVTGNQFKGYDFGSGQHFSGTVNGTRIALYDFEHAAFFNYSI